MQVLALALPAALLLLPPLRAGPCSHSRCSAASSRAAPVPAQRRAEPFGPLLQVRGAARPDLTLPQHGHATLCHASLPLFPLPSARSVSLGKLGRRKLSAAAFATSRSCASCLACRTAPPAVPHRLPASLPPNVSTPFYAPPTHTRTHRLNDHLPG